MSVNSLGKENQQFYTTDISTIDDRSISFSNFSIGNKSKKNLNIIANGNINGYQYDQFTNIGVKIISQTIKIETNRKM